MHHHPVGQHRHADPGGYGDSQVPSSAHSISEPPGASHAQARRKPAQAQQQKDRGDHFDQELRGRQIRRRQPHKADAGRQARAAGQNQRGQAVKLRECRGRDRAGSPDSPKQRERRVECAQTQVRQVDWSDPGAEPGGDKPGDHDQQELRLELLGRETHLDLVGELLGDQSHARLEHPSGAERAQDRGPGPAAQLRVQQTIGRQADRHRDRAHRERRRQAMPYGQRELRGAIAEHRVGRQGQEGLDRH